MPRHSVAAASCLALTWMACVCLGASGHGEATIRKGDKVRVINGPAPIKVGEKTLTTVETGTVLEALEVKGDWVKVKAAKDGWVYTGWIKAATHLETTPAEEPKEKKGSGEEDIPSKEPRAKARMPIPPRVPGKPLKLPGEKLVAVTDLKFYGYREDGKFLSEVEGTIGVVEVGARDWSYAIRGVNGTRLKLEQAGQGLVEDDLWVEQAYEIVNKAGTVVFRYDPPPAAKPAPEPAK